MVDNPALEKDLKAVMVEQLCEDWLASLHNARATTINAYR
jgi:hypothetical protein